MYALRNISYCYPGSESISLREIDLDLPEAGAIAVRGDNGSGKSTLGLVMCGAIPWLLGGEFEGNILLDGDVLSSGEIAGLSVLASQDPLMYFAGHTVAEESGALDRGREDFRQIARQVLGSRPLDTPLSCLSLGQQQLLAAASALLSGRAVVILDEPFSSLDPRATATVCRLMEQTRDSGALVIVLCSPYNDPSPNLFDAVYALSHGNLSDEPILEWRTEPFQEHRQRSQGDCVLEVLDVSHSYSQGQPAMKPMNFCVRRGESVCVIGDNGVGKTTLLLLVSGLLRCRKGRVLIHGSPARSRHLRNCVRCAFQNPDIQLFGNSVLEELSFGPRWTGVDEGQVQGRIEKVASMLPFGLDSDPFALSYGQRKLLSIAAAFVLDPAVIALDEPLAGLDMDSRTVVRRLLQDHLAGGGAALIAAHDRLTPRYLCHRAVPV